MIATLMEFQRLRLCLSGCLLLVNSALHGTQVAYIYGDIADDGTLPSGAAPPFHQMLLTDTGNRGCSEFKALVEAEGYSITQFYDQATTLNAAFLNPLDVVVFGLHQKVWSAAEKAALNTWIESGGGILMYSDSAAGGWHSLVGIKNTIGQTAVNNVLTQYGLQVTVDQGGGVRAYTSSTNACSPIVWDQPEFEGEGVSPVAVDESTGAQALIPFEEAFKVSGSTLNLDTRNITLSNPRWAAVAHRQVGNGNVIAIFDRQPTWNNGEGSSIQKRDNREILRRIVKFLARDYANSPKWFRVSAAMRVKPADGKSYLEMTYRQWRGGSGIIGVNYTAHDSIFKVEYTPNLWPATWVSGSTIVEQVGAAVNNGDDTETVTVRILPTNADNPMGFARLTAECANGNPSIPLTVDAGDDAFIGQTGVAWLNGAVTGSNVLSITWSNLSGPGSVSFANAASPVTTATFSAPGVYQLALTASYQTSQASDSMMVRVVGASDVVHAINCGGSAYSGTSGFSYEADTLFTGGHTDAFPGNAVANTAEDLLYNYARSQHSAYTLPVTNGNYLVLLQFAETWFTATNKRVFDTLIEGSLVLDDLDLYATAPGKWVAYNRAFTTTVNDGQLNLNFTASVNNSLLNAIVVIRN